MCRTCGCDEKSEKPEPRSREAGSHGLFVFRENRGATDLPVRLLEANDVSAARTRSRLAAHGVLALNVVGTPGAGKTTLLGATIDRLLGMGPRPAVVKADLATDNDARRLRREGVPVVGLETGAACHLSAPLLERALDHLPLDRIDVLLIENVGNLVCPALFDVGEAAKVALISVTEGSDKPEKYPVMFRSAALLLINKIDLLPHVDFDLEAAAAHARRIHPEIEVLTLSAKTGEGMLPWLDWIRTRRARSPSRAARASTR